MHDSILETIGSPLVRLSAPSGATIAAKVESQNPGGSVKVRPAREMVETAEREGEIEPGDSLVEATSGNTGIGLALVAAAKGYDLTIVMPESVSMERRQVLRAYGATLELVEEGMDQATDLAAQIEAETGAYQISQFENPANPASHVRTTAEEILEQVGDREIDVFVAAVGTGGTISGTARRLLQVHPDMLVVGVEPGSSPFLSMGQPAEHEFQGMGPDFIPDTLDREVIDAVQSVDIDTAEAECRRLAREEGILVGQSSGAASVAARRIAERRVGDIEEARTEADGTHLEDVGTDTAGTHLEEVGTDTTGTRIDEDVLVVTVLPDSGERYLSTGLFD